MNFRNVIVYWLPPLVWMAVISPVNDLLTSQSTSSFIVPILRWLLPSAGQDMIETIHLAIRKLSHFVEYAFLAFLLFRALRGRSRIWRLKWGIYAGMIAIIYAVMDEYVQTLVPSRTGSVDDWLIDSSGVVCALGIIAVKGLRIRD